MDISILNGFVKILFEDLCYIHKAYFKVVFLLSSYDGILRVCWTIVEKYSSGCYRLYVYPVG